MKNYTTYYKDTSFGRIPKAIKQKSPRKYGISYKRLTTRTQTFYFHTLLDISPLCHSLQLFLQCSPSVDSKFWL